MILVDLSDVRAKIDAEGRRRAAGASAVSRARRINGPERLEADHARGLAGEVAAARYLELDERKAWIWSPPGRAPLAGELDGGTDLIGPAGERIQIKTPKISRHLIVSVYEPLRSDYYVLARSPAPPIVELHGFVERRALAAAPQIQLRGGPARVIPCPDGACSLCGPWIGMLGPMEELRSRLQREER